MRLSCRLFWLTLLLLVPTQPVQARKVSPMTMTIGEGWALVREVREIELQRGVQEITLEGIPPEADLSTLVLKLRRLRLEVLEWTREQTGGEKPVGPGLKMDGMQDEVIWTPGQPPGLEGGKRVGHAVRCTVNSLRKGKQKVRISYRVPGFDWEVMYRVTVRGEREEETEPLSVDLSATVHITNPTQAAYEGVLVRLVDEGVHAPGDQPKPPGFLMLDDSNPLFDLWNPQAPEEMPGYIFTLPKTLVIYPGVVTQSEFTRVRRLPAEHLYVITDDIAPLGIEAKKPLRKYIVFNNDQANGLGYPLPPGQAEIVLGGSRGLRIQPALLPRTWEGEPIRVDLGLADGVLGTRYSQGRSRTIEGVYQEYFVIVIQNDKPTEVLTEIDEKPPVQLKWDVVRSNVKYEISGGRLKFTPTLGAKSEEKFYYELRVTQPSL